MKVLWAINKKNNMGPANGDKALGHPCGFVFLVESFCCGLSKNNSNLIDLNQLTFNQYEVHISYGSYSRQ